MRPDAIRIIIEEHDALSAMLRSFGMMVDRPLKPGEPQDFEVLRAMLFYIDEFPERLHHPKESGILFPMLRKHSREAAEILDRLDNDHEGGERYIRQLQHDLLSYEMLGESRRAHFVQAAHRYIEFYLMHMSLEETVVLPLARKVLTEEDRAELDRAFEANRDPLTGHPPEEDYRQLFSRIVMTAPAPIGLGRVQE